MLLIYKIRLSMKTMQLLKIGLLLSAQVNYVDGAGMRSRNMQQIVYTEQDEFEMNQHSDTSTVKELHLQTVSDANAIGGSRRQLSFWSSFMNHVHCPLHPHDCDHHKKKSSGGSSHGKSGNGTGNSKNANGNGGGYNDNGSNVETAGGDGGYGGSNNDNDGSNNDNDGGNSGNDNDYNGNNNNGDNGDSGNNDNGTSGNSYYVTNGEYYNGNSGNTYNGNSGNNDNGNSGNNYNGNNGNNDSGNNDNDGNSTQFYISNDGEYETRNSSSLGSEMMYGAMSLGGIAVLASLISRSRRRNINMDDHLLNGAVDKRKNTFAGLFQKKPNNSASELSTNYVAA